MILFRRMMLLINWEDATLDYSGIRKDTGGLSEIVKWIYRHRTMWWWRRTQELVHDINTPWLPVVSSYTKSSNQIVICCFTLPHKPEKQFLKYNKLLGHICFESKRFCFLFTLTGMRWSYKIYYELCVSHQICPCFYLQVYIIHQL